MNIYHSIAQIASSELEPVAVIGNFDGVHKGHRLIVERAVKKARQLNRPCALITFEPHPRSIFRPDDPPFRLTPYSLKMRKLAETGLDFVLSLPFDWDFASLSPKEFIHKILQERLRPCHIFIGYDFRFGQMRRGGTADLAAAGLEVSIVKKITDGHGQAFSSSQIRSHLRHGHIARANSQLGWPWEIEGNVVRGDRRGREIGFPTANVDLGQTVHPAYGIYASYVWIADKKAPPSRHDRKPEDGIVPDARFSMPTVQSSLQARIRKKKITSSDEEENGSWHMAATNIGIRPMFEVPVGQVESYIFDFEGDLYDRCIRIRPVKFMRGEAKFETLEKLVHQIELDCLNIRTYLTNYEEGEELSTSDHDISSGF